MKHIIHVYSLTQSIVRCRAPGDHQLQNFMRLIEPVIPEFYVDHSSLLFNLWSQTSINTAVNYHRIVSMAPLSVWHTIPWTLTLHCVH